MAWIDSKAHDMVPQSWIIDCLKIYKISGEVIKFIENTMGNRRAKLKAERKNLAKVKILIVIFQGFALSPLLFVKAMMPSYHKFRKCTG